MRTVCRELYLGNFAILVENYNIVRALLNSVLVTGVAVTANLVASVASFALAKIAFPGHRLLFALIVAFLLVPGQVLLIPIYLLFSRLELVNNYLSVILIYTALALPFGILPDVELPCYSDGADRVGPDRRRLTLPCVPLDHPPHRQPPS